MTEEEALEPADGAAAEAAAEEAAGAGAIRGRSLLLNGPGAGARLAGTVLPMLVACSLNITVLRQQSHGHEQVQKKDFRARMASHMHFCLICFVPPVRICLFHGNPSLW